MNMLGIYFNIAQFNRVVCFLIKEQSIFPFIFSEVVTELISVISIVGKKGK